MVLISQGLITDEVLLLLDLSIARNPEFSYDVYDRFDLDEIDQAECKLEFRIDKRHIPFLADVLGLPATIRCPQTTVADGFEEHISRLFLKLAGSFVNQERI